MRCLFLIDALKDALGDPANDEEFQRRLTDTYYDDRINYDTIEAILGREEAMRLKLLRESTYSTPDIPELEKTLVAADAGRTDRKRFLTRYCELATDDNDLD